MIMAKIGVAIHSINAVVFLCTRLGRKLAVVGFG